MRKFLLCLISVVMLIACLSVVGFAADTDFYYGDLVVNDTTATVNLYFEPEEDGSFRSSICSLEAYYNVSNGTVGTSNFKGSIDGMTCASEVANGLISFYCDSYVDASAANVVNKFTITREGNAKTSVITLRDVAVNDYAMSDISATYPETFTIEWPSAADPIATEYTTDEGKTYTSVPNKTFTDVAVADLSNFGGNVTVTYEGGVNTYFTKAFTFGGLGTGSGTASFDVAVVGVPSNITVTDIAVAIN